MKYLRFRMVFIILLIFLCLFPAFADASAEGYGIYHDRAFNLYYWHTGLMNTASPDVAYEDNKSLNEVVIHLKSLSSGGGFTTCTIDYASFSEFNNGKAFMGYYSAVSDSSLVKRTQVLTLARLLLQTPLNYYTTKQLKYDNEQALYSLLQLRVPISDITGMRCDGLLEYVYEKCDVEIFGLSDDAVSVWNISCNGLASRNRHSGSISTFAPETQAEYMRNQLGDINADGEITPADARLALRYSLELEMPNAYQAFVANVTGSGTDITPADARLIERASLGLEGTVSLIGTIRGYRFPNDPFAQ